MKCFYGSLKRQVKKKIWSQNLVMIFFFLFMNYFLFITLKKIKSFGLWKFFQDNVSNFFKVVSVG